RPVFIPNVFSPNEDEIMISSTSKQGLRLRKSNPSTSIVDGENLYSKFRTSNPMIPLLVGMVTIEGKK
ncbi:MAG: hypothetical protein MK226_07100, partial [Saprospiraceae bacterium]|nr:hypothetical protein [Saprospiraceae bacterium]